MTRSGYLRKDFKKGKVAAHLLKVTGERVKLDSVPSLEAAKQLVGGWVEAVNYIDPADRRRRVLLVNEEGRLKHLPVNQLASKLFGSTLVGDVVQIDAARWS